jgi:2,5-diamino-6-(ribosylamino)-4(3H)-pyrimidinone 5'-phosphate reductase
LNQQPRPFVFLNIATTVDGKLAPATRHFVPFGSRRDHELLFELRARADAVMAGARTVDLAKVDLGPGPEKYRRMRVKHGLKEYNLRVVVSGSGTLNPQAEIFRRRFSPIIIIASGRAGERRLRRLRDLADAVEVFGDEELDFVAALAWLRKAWGVKQLLCEGGGEINAGLFRAALVDEIHQTVCPFIFGGRNAPTLSDGIGVKEVRDATRLKLKSLRRYGDELYLVYRVKRLVPKRTTRHCGLVQRRSYCAMSR